ncbi:heterogeneous nuclear ribonucleoprotein M [Spea bombifrons]|uniref:heterogeneous nuclear ribonucleoprotein M n=1 Tax=Spea bombifrons TaxID=233779 RepID=UPI00234A8032|nr:heterogeneous nuclear ribonucleoprotein M [Spea bombifrons]
MASSALIKVKIQRNLPKKEEASPGGTTGSNGTVEDNKETQASGDSGQTQQNDKRKDKVAKKTNRFEPYNPQKRFRAFISNIPFDVKWQALKDLVKEKVGEVTYVELLMDDEGKSRGCAAVEFKLEESMKKAVQVLNKHVMNGRPLKIREDPHGERSRRAAQGVFGPGPMGMGGPGPMGMGGPGPMGMGGPGPMGMPAPMGMGGPGPMGMGPGPSRANMNIPPSILNNPNIPGDVIHALQSGRLGSTVFVANLDYSVGWKKLKEVFGIAGTVVRADVLEDKDGKSRGIGTVTYEQPIEAVQAISMFNAQLLFDRPMMVKMDDKAMPKGDHFSADRPPQLPHGLGGIGMGLGPGGQPIDANHLRSSNIGGPGGMDSMGYGMNKMGIDGPPIGGNGNLGSLSRYGSGMGLGRMSTDIDRGLAAGFDRGELGSLSRGYNDPLERGLSSGASNLGANIDRMSSAIGRGVDRVGSDIDRMGLVMDRMGPSADRIGSGMGSGMGSLGMDISSSIDRIVASSLDRMSTGMGYGVDRMGSGMDRVSSGIDRMGSNLDRIGSGMDRVGIDRMGSSSMDRMGSGLDRMGPIMDRLPPVDRLSASSLGRVGLDRIGSSSLDRMGTGLGMSTSMGLGMGSSFDRPMDVDQSKFGNNFGSSFGGAGGNRPAAAPRKGCQIFVRNLSFDCTWKMLKDKFNDCGHVVYADIKMENGKSKGCGVVKFESPEVAERACRMMNGTKLGGREIDVRMDRNA